jgi:xanthine dehydrogenase accessory factor
MDVYDALARARAEGREVALVTVLAAGGAAPSQPGAKLVVGHDGVLAGTLGCSEFDTAGTQLAGEAFDAGGPLRRTLTFAGDPEDRELELFAEVHRPEPAVLVLGATPVGRAVADLARTVGRRAVLVSPAGGVGVAPRVEVRADDPARFLLAAPPGPADAVVISDHDAPWVDEAVRVALASGAFFVGMLGSRRHAPSVVQRLRGSGVPDGHLAKLRSPCGLDIGSRSAAEIALSIVAEIVAAERGRDGGRLGVDWTQTDS